jgi:hypothetical protein
VPPKEWCLYFLFIKKKVFEKNFTFVINAHNKTFYNSIFALVQSVLCPKTQIGLTNCFVLCCNKVPCHHHRDMPPVINILWKFSNKKNNRIKMKKILLILTFGLYQPEFYQEKKWYWNWKSFFLRVNFLNPAVELKIPTY